jgi:NAD(P)-dependent dehydrogenase (short-subunit alcohol dehydrogenase family)
MGMKMELNNRVSIVTGAGSGIGRAIALEFAKHGSKVVCCGRRIELLNDTVDKIEHAGGKSIAIQADVTSIVDVERLMQVTLDKFNKLDVLINNAGSFNAFGALWEVDPEMWWNDVTVNLRGSMQTMQAALKIMIPQNNGIIINMSGGGAITPLPGGSGYGASKAALLRLTESLARELEIINSHILVVAMGPGLVHTEMTQLQVDSEAARRWIPSTAENLANGNSRPPEDCARDIVKLLHWINPSFNGKLFNVGMSFETIAKQLLNEK